MWILTTQGFYSAVAHRDDPDSVIVRARARKDIEALRKQIPGIEPFEDPTADYRHRAVVGRAEWVAAVAQLASEIDYDNFKNAVAERQGPARAKVYGEVWSVLRKLGRSVQDLLTEKGIKPDTSRDGQISIRVRGNRIKKPE